MVEIINLPPSSPGTVINLTFEVPVSDPSRPRGESGPSHPYDRSRPSSTLIHSWVLLASEYIGEQHQYVVVSTHRVPTLRDAVSSLSTVTVGLTLQVRERLDRFSTGGLQTQ